MTGRSKISMSGLGAGFIPSLGVTLMCLANPAPVKAQLASTSGRGATVSWIARPSVIPSDARKAVISLHGTIRDGWHIYALKQSTTGPTPLIVAIEPNDVALRDGKPVGSAPTVAFEPAFGFATPYYTRDVTITVPVRLHPHLAAGRRLVPVSVRYQSCDGRICEPPTTVRLTAPIDIQAIG